MISRRQLFGLLATVALAGCTQPQQADPPLPMGAPLPKAAKQDGPPVDVGDVPATFRVKFETTKGVFVIEAHRDRSPHGAARFYDAVKAGFYDECRFFRVVPGFMVQWGINGTPKVQSKWRDAEIKDDIVPAKERASNTRGYITFAKSGKPHSRTTQLFINYGDNARLDADGFTPFGKVIEGMEVVDKINAKYRERPNQGAIQEEGNAYLNENFPDLDFIKKATIVEAKK